MSGGERLHQQAPDYNTNIQEQFAANDPKTALEKFMAEKTMLQAENAKMKDELAYVKKELDDAKKIAADLAPYADIIADTKTFLPVYLRRAVTWKRLLGKLRTRYGKLVDINSPSKEGRKAAHLRIDSAVEEIIEYALLTWHNVQGRLEVRDAIDSE